MDAWVERLLFAVIGVVLTLLAGAVSRWVKRADGIVELRTAWAEKYIAALEHARANPDDWEHGGEMTPDLLIRDRRSSALMSTWSSLRLTDRRMVYIWRNAKHASTGYDPYETADGFERIERDRLRAIETEEIVVRWSQRSLLWPTWRLRRLLRADQVERRGSMRIVTRVTNADGSTTVEPYVPRQLPKRRRRKR